MSYSTHFVSLLAAIENGGTENLELITYLIDKYRTPTPKNILHFISLLDYRAVGRSENPGEPIVISYGTVVRDLESEAKTRCNFQFR